MAGVGRANLERKTQLFPLTLLSLMMSMLGRAGDVRQTFAGSWNVPNWKNCVGSMQAVMLKTMMAVAAVGLA